MRPTRDGNSAQAEQGACGPKIGIGSVESLLHAGAKPTLQLAASILARSFHVMSVHLGHATHSARRFAARHAARGRSSNKASSPSARC